MTRHDQHTSDKIKIETGMEHLNTGLSRMRARSQKKPTTKIQRQIKNLKKGSLLSALPIESEKYRK